MLVETSLHDIFKTIENVTANSQVFNQQQSYGSWGWVESFISMHCMHSITLLLYRDTQLAESSTVRKSTVFTLSVGAKSKPVLLSHNHFADHDSSQIMSAAILQSVSGKYILAHGFLETPINSCQFSNWKVIAK